MRAPAWDIGEFGLIDRIRASFPKSDLTDDCASVNIPFPGTLLLTTDSAVQGVHFPEGEEFLADAGFRALAGAASDINASAGEPIGALLALNIPKALSLEGFDAFIGGLSACSVRFGIPLLGGNITRSEQFSATISVFGLCERPLARDNAAEGDLLLVSGELGGSEAGRMVVMNEVPEELRSVELAARFLRPEPPFGLGKILAKIGATSMIDISDGLLADIRHIADSSGLGISVELEKLPILPGVFEIAEYIGENPYILAATSGEEYQLAFTIPEAKIAATEELPFKTTTIGRLSSGSGLHPRFDNKPVDIKKAGWRHF